MEKLTEKEELDAKLKEREFNFQACSALTKEGLSEGFEWLIKQISEKQNA
jgi:hypothetical protein